MKKLLMIAALSLVGSSAFAATQSVTLYGDSTTEVEQKVAGFLATLKAGGMPMQLAGNKACKDPNRNEFGRGTINPFQRTVYAVQFNDNTFVVQADGTLRPSYSATLKVSCRKKLSNR